MKEKGHNTAFYIETLVMILVFIAVILLLTRVFAMAKLESAEAKMTTTAVAIAENTAEALKAADDREEFCTFVADGAVTDDGEKIEFTYDEDMDLAPDGRYVVDVTWQEEDGLITNDISVRLKDSSEPVYTLTTKEAAR